MTLKEFFKEIENQAIDTYIVTLKYKYDFEKNYTIENQILEYVSIGDEYVWENDWYEGQTDVEVLGYMLLDDVDTTKLKPCEDFISREAVDYILFEVEASTDAHLNTSLKIIKNRINALPSVTPQRQRGRWKLIREEYEYMGGIINEAHIRCSICDTEIRYKTNFCPECGADMREGEE